MKRICVIFLMVALLVTSAQAVKTHYWDFEDGTANDSVGTAHGTLNGGAYVGGGKLVTTAQDQWMSMDGSIIAVNTYSELTVEAWYTPTAGANQSWSMLVSLGSNMAPDNAWMGVDYFFITSARGDDVSRAAISCGDYSTPWLDEDGVNGPEYDDGKLHHMVGTVTATDIALYIDGVLLGTTPLTGDNSIANMSNDLALISKAVYNDDPEWIGWMHEVSIYDHAMNEQEVRAAFDAGIPEPTTIALLGLGTLALLRRRK